MVNLALVELKSHSKTKNKNLNLLNQNNSHLMGFILCNNNIDTVETKDVTNEILKGTYYLESKYTIIYLYDIMRDNSESSKFITNYGGKLHNETSQNITILTYLSPDMVRNWKNVHFREKIKCATENNAAAVSSVIEELQKFYNVKTLPALIVLKKEKDKKEDSCIIDASNKSETELYSLFKHVIEVINDNCEEDFSVIASKCATSYKKEKPISNYFTYNYVYDKVKEKRKDIEDFSQITLAGHLNMTERTLRNKRINNTFTEDECIHMGFLFELNVDDINTLLDANHHKSLAFYGKDEIIRSFINNRNYNVNELCEKLNKEGFKGIIKDDKLAE